MLDKSYFFTIPNLNPTKSIHNEFKKALLHHQNKKKRPGKNVGVYNLHCDKNDAS